MQIHNKNSRKGKMLPLIAFSFIIQFIGLSSLSAEESVSVGVVNISSLMENSPQSESASAALKTKFTPQEKSLAADLKKINALEAELNEIKQATENVELIRQKERELRAKKRLRSRILQDFREELRFARDAALDEVQKGVFNAIDEVRAQKNIDIILQDYISASTRVDITPDVLEYLKQKADQEAPKEQDTQTEPSTQ